MPDTVHQHTSHAPQASAHPALLFQHQILAHKYLCPEFHIRPVPSLKNHVLLNNGLPSELPLDNTLQNRYELTKKSSCFPPLLIA